MPNDPSRSLPVSDAYEGIFAGISLRGPPVQRGLLVAALCDEALEHFALVIDGAPEIVLHAHGIAERNPFRIAM